MVCLKLCMCVCVCVCVYVCVWGMLHTSLCACTCCVLTNVQPHVFLCNPSPDVILCGWLGSKHRLTNLCNHLLLLLFLFCLLVFCVVTLFCLCVFCDIFCSALSELFVWPVAAIARASTASSLQLPFPVSWPLPLPHLPHSSTRRPPQSVILVLQACPTILHHRVASC